MKTTRHSFNATLGLSVLIGLLSLASPGALLGQIWCGTPMSPAPPPQGPNPCPPESPNSSSQMGGEGSSCKVCSSSPCYAQSGVFFTSAVDLTLQAVGSPLGVSRTYNTTYLSSGLTGPGWTTNLAIRLTYSVYLYAAPSTYQKQADIRMPDSRLFTFTENADGVTYTAPPSRHDTLVRQSDGTWDLNIEHTRTVWHFGSDGSLASITDDYGNVQSWSYDTNGRLQRITDEVSGRYIDVYFGADGRLSAVQDNAGRLVQYAYNADGSLASVADPLNRLTTYAYGAGRFGPILTQITDNWDRVVATMTYDSQDRVTSYNEDGETYSYDYSRVAQGYTIKKDSQNNQWTLGYNSAGYVTDVTKPDGTAKHTDFNADGTVQGVTDEVGIRTAYTYDTQGRVLTVTRDATHNGPRTEYTYDPNFPDQVTATTVKNPSTNQVDPSWQSWQYDYYQLGDPAPGALHHVYRIQSDGTTRDTVATYVYDNHGRVIQEITATGATTDYAFDAQGNLATVTAPANNDLGTRPVTAYAYDALGHVTSITDSLGHVTTIASDAIGRILAVTPPRPALSSVADYTTTYSYDTWDSGANLVYTALTDPNANVTRQGRDQYGRIVKSVDALNNTTTYAYSRDLLSSITDPNNNLTWYVYDALKHLIGITSPDGASQSFTYFNDGRLHTRTDRKGQTISYTYDALGRPTSKTSPDSSVIAYTHRGQQLATVVDGTMTPSETHTFTYDASYRLESVAEGLRGTVGYTYASDDRVATMTVQNGPTTTYTHYPDGSLNTIEWSPVAGQFKFAYTLRGQRDTVTFPNGQTRSWVYDNQGRLTLLANVHPTVGPLGSFAYMFDIDPQTHQTSLLGKVTSSSITVPRLGLSNAITAYRYDAKYQLAQTYYPSVAPYDGEVQSWTYDAIGNRLTSTVNASTQAYTYFRNGNSPLNGQRLQSDGVDAYTYDANGNVLTTSGTGGSLAFGWDARDRMISISGAVNASYAYDYQGRRTSKTASGSTFSYLYDGLNLVRATGPTGADYLFGPGIDEPLAVSQGGSVSYYVVDGLGSVNLLTDSSGTVQNAYLYDAWGSIKGQTSMLADSFGYTAREFGEAGLWFYRARYYKAQVGRFLQEDPLPQARFGLYGYVSNSPVSHADPSGTKTVVRVVPLPEVIEGCEGHRDLGCEIYRPKFSCYCRCVGSSFRATPIIDDPDIIVYAASNCPAADPDTILRHEFQHVRMDLEAMIPIVIAARVLAAKQFNSEFECLLGCWRWWGVSVKNHVDLANERARDFDASEPSRHCNYY